MSIELNLPPHRVDEIGCMASNAYRRWSKAVDEGNVQRANRIASFAFALIEELRSAAPEEQRERWAQLIEQGGETQKP